VNPLHLLAVGSLHREVGVGAGRVALDGVVCGRRLLLLPNFLLQSLHRVVDEDRPAEERFRVVNVPEFPDGHLEDALPVFPEPELGAGQHGGRGRSLPGGVQEFF